MTFVLRPNQPLLTPDGELLDFAIASDGTAEVTIVDASGVESLDVVGCLMVVL